MEANKIYHLVDCNENYIFRFDIYAIYNNQHPIYLELYKVNSIHLKEIANEQDVCYILYSIELIFFL